MSASLPLLWQPKAGLQKCQHGMFSSALSHRTGRSAALREFFLKVTAILLPLPPPPKKNKGPDMNNIIGISEWAALLAPSWCLEKCQNPLTQGIAGYWKRLPWTEHMENMGELARATLHPLRSCLKQRWKIDIEASPPESFCLAHLLCQIQEKLVNVHVSLYVPSRYEDGRVRSKKWSPSKTRRKDPLRSLPCQG